ncbi:MAG: aminotransferase class I/II-fold pyridoxal phosphate-dependent enzyme, partial [Candidatus Omnitrophica bacterium]|nr:aminotransferase class I/II-fold pyridoxal phosphate-dependent enzyme [Candidatus Omnitrophota bacterium]
MKIRLVKPYVGRQELQNIKDIFKRAWLGNGPKVAEFEIAWSKYLGCRASVAVNSGTAALHLALWAYKFPKGKKVFVPAMTFISTANAALYNNLIPLFVDVEEETLQMDLEDMKRKYSDDCVAIIPVHFGGHPVPMDELMPWARSRNLKVISDCAHCAGGQYKGKKLGTWADVNCFSFEEKKCLTTGDG